jgi:putative ABC transport system permease protein
VINDFRFALRQLLKAPSLTLVATLSLAIGIGLNTAAFSIINTIFYQTIRGIAQPSEVVFFNQSVNRNGYRELREQTGSFRGIAAGRALAVTVDDGVIPMQWHAQAVSDNYFSLLGVHMAMGRTFRSAAPDTPLPGPEIVLDHSFWKRHFGSDPSVLGRQILLDGGAFRRVPSGRRFG